MPHERVVMVVDASARLAPEVTHLHVVSLDALHPELDALLRRHEDAPFALSVEQLFDTSQLHEVVRRHDASLVVAGPWPSRSVITRALSLVELASPSGVDVASIGARVPDAPTPSGVVAVTMHVSSTMQAATAAEVRALRGVSRVALLIRGATQEQLEAMEPLWNALLPAHVVTMHAVNTGVSRLGAELQRHERELNAELMLAATDDLWASSRFVAGLFAAQDLADAERPVLMLHRAANSELLPQRLTATDLVRGRVLLERSDVRGRVLLDPDETFFLVGAETRGALSHRHGVVEVPTDWLPSHLTHVAFASTRAPQTLAHARVLSSQAPLLLDARLPMEQLRDVESQVTTRNIVFVRLRAHETLAATRTRLDATVPWGGPVQLLDATALLDDGGAGDVPEAVDALRLRRLERLLSPPPPALPATSGHRVQLSLDNHVERRRLLDAIAAATERIHWQCYIVDDDATSRDFALALREAAARGVMVRVLVDALYSLHDVYGARNPVLETLAGATNVEVRVTRALEGVPTLDDLKQRNHRKLVVVDGRTATLSGRNLGATYYRAFDEVPLTAQSSYRDVPWLDASAVLEGPLVEAVEHSFLSDWRGAGGGDFVVSPVAQVGGLACRLVLHDGLRDTNTFDTQLELVHSAKQRLLLVNTFPLVLELQHALLAALKRGVDVRLLFGNVRPRWGAGQLFPGGTLRALGDNLVRARLDPLLRAGARGYEYGRTHATLGTLWPHVHAKLIVRDDDLVAVGSANLDVTSAYWESEAMLLVDDVNFARQTLTQLDALLATSWLVDPLAPEWTHDAERRRWLAHNWPSIVG